MCKWLLDRNGAEGDYFLERIVTGDETWIHHYEPDSKHQNAEWKHPHSPAKKKFRTDPTAGKLTFQFLGLTRLLLEHYQERGSTVTSAGYSEMLCDKLKPAIQSKQRGILLEGVVLLGDNAHLAMLHTVLKPLTIGHRNTYKGEIAIPCIVDGSRLSTFSYTTSCTCVCHLVWLTYHFKVIDSLMQDVWVSSYKQTGTDPSIFRTIRLQQRDHSFRHPMFSCLTSFSKLNLQVPWRLSLLLKS